MTYFFLCCSFSPIWNADRWSLFCISSSLNVGHHLVFAGGTYLSADDSRCTHLVVDDHAISILPEMIKPNGFIVRAEVSFTFCTLFKETVYLYNNMNKLNTSCFLWPLCKATTPVYLYILFIYSQKMLGQKRTWM